jgi:signal transduction histidine kinase
MKRAALAGIARDSTRASAVIASLRAMFRKDVHGRAWISVNELLRDVLAMVDVELRTERVSVSTDFHDGIPQLLADRGQLQQVFSNLILNAIEAMRSVTDRERLLRVTTDIQESSGVLIAIEDTGTGIDRKNKDRIFEPFFTTKSAGTGIGLTICRSIIESHAGTLRATANKPFGTVFHVALPRGDL